MKKAIAVAFALAISAAYAASSYNVVLYKATSINGTQLKPGDVKVEVAGDKVIIKQGKTTVESPVTVENGAQKFYSNSVSYSGSNPDQVQEIRLAGTSTKLLFGSTPNSASAASGR
jgi:phage baseplate assembly protein gpV